MADEEQEYTFRLIAPGDNLAGLSLGSEAFVDLKTYFRRHAHDHHVRGFAKTYGAFAQNSPKKAVGCITLVCGEISVNDVGQADGLSSFHYDHCPAVKIARFAVDSKHRKKGVGKALVDLVLGVVSEFVSPKVGCRFVVVDSKRESVSSACHHRWPGGGGFGLGLSPRVRLTVVISGPVSGTGFRFFGGRL